MSCEYPGPLWCAYIRSAICCSQPAARAFAAVCPFLDKLEREGDLKTRLPHLSMCTHISLKPSQYDYFRR